MRDQGPDERDQPNEVDRDRLPSIYPLAGCFPLLSETHFNELMKEDIDRRGVMRRREDSRSSKDNEASGQVPMNRTGVFRRICG